MFLDFETHSNKNRGMAMKAMWIYAAWNWFAPRARKKARRRAVRALRAGSRGTTARFDARARHENAARNAMREWLWV